MSELLRGEFCSSEQHQQRSNSSPNNIPTNPTTTSLLESDKLSSSTNPEQQDNVFSSSSSHSNSSSCCDYTISSNEIIAKEGYVNSEQSVLKDLDDLSNNSLDSFQYHSDSNYSKEEDHNSERSLAEYSSESSSLGLSGNGEVASSENSSSNRSTPTLSGSDQENGGDRLLCNRNQGRTDNKTSSIENKISRGREEIKFIEFGSRQDSGSSVSKSSTVGSCVKSQLRRKATTSKETLKRTTTSSYPENYYSRRTQTGGSGSSGRSTVDSSVQTGELAQSRGRKTNWLRRFDNFLHRMSVKIARYHKELCIIFLILASGIASLRTTPTKIKATSLPSPFFEEKDASFFIKDNYMGEYVDLANKQIPFHPSFLFYYAPWDSESVASKEVFLSVAKHFYFAYHGRVKFYAINCWWPGGQCRKNYKNLSHYPIFVAHIGKAAGIIYNGPIRLQPMVKFFNSLLKPVTRIDTEEELWKFRAQHDVIMLGYFNFTVQESVDAYETYLQMALRTFEADPFNQVGFGLFLRPELAEKFFLTSANAISLVLFNEIHTAKWHGGYQQSQGIKGPVTQVAEWVIERTKEVPITWVYALRNGFANRPAALGPHDFAYQLSQGPVFLLVSRRYFPSGHSPFYMQVKEVALDYFNCNRSGNVTKLRRTAHKINSEWASIWSSVVEICQRKGSFQCQQLMPNIQHWLKKRFLFKRESLMHYENVSAALNFTGMSCESERQFKFLAIDPVDVPYFINLGLSGLKNSDDTKYSIDPMAFIIDSQNDIIMPLNSLNITDMAIAIHNYTLATESGDVDSLSTQLFLNNNGGEETEIHQNVDDKSKTVVDDGVLETWSSDDLIQYVNGNIHPNDSALVLYTAPFCGYCGLAITHFVALSRFLEENYGNGALKVKLATINMFKNSLPPILNPEELPTVVFVPSWNRTNIKMYPENQEISPLGLLRFVLSELEPSVRVQASLMSPSCGSNNKFCAKTQSDNGCQQHAASSSSSSMWKAANSTGIERSSCIKSSRNSVSSQIELLLQKLQNGEEAMFDSTENSFRRMTPQAWNGQLLDRLRTMAVTLDVS